MPKSQHNFFNDRHSCSKHILRNDSFGCIGISWCNYGRSSERIYDAAVFRDLELLDSNIKCFVEYGFLSCVAGVVSAFVGVLASWAVVQFLMRIEWQLDVFVWLYQLYQVFITLFLGLSILGGPSGRKPPVLRNDGYRLKFLFRPLT